MSSHCGKLFYYFLFLRYKSYGTVVHRSSNTFKKNMGQIFFFSIFLFAICLTYNLQPTESSSRPSPAPTAKPTQRPTARPTNPTCNYVYFIIILVVVLIILQSMPPKPSHPSYSLPTIFPKSSSFVSPFATSDGTSLDATL